MQEAMQEQQDTPASNADRITNAAKLVGESVLPGASLMMDGKLANGAVHALLGFGARALAGPAGIVLIAADSYSKSVSDKYLWDHIAPLWKRRGSKTNDALEAEEVLAEAPQAAPAASTPKSGKS
ncbi:MAG: hypothetical protein H2060_01975 [Azoarcus sp.]|jgi:hypothetical protein|nr:hypothetical protein [Azoarcus sp.]